jgi:hypothetical protein
MMISEEFMIQQAWIAMSNNKQGLVQEILQALQVLIHSEQLSGEHLLVNSRPTNNHKQMALMMYSRSLRASSLWVTKGNRHNRSHKQEGKLVVLVQLEKLREKMCL